MPNNKRREIVLAIGDILDVVGSLGLLRESIGADTDADFHRIAVLRNAERTLETAAAAINSKTRKGQE